ncbi:unnamed protein product [Effrenium voratum]|nr:unnamed protein product [Effrenium voratum]
MIPMPSGNGTWVIPRRPRCLRAEDSTPISDIFKDRRTTTTAQCQAVLPPCASTAPTAKGLFTGRFALRRRLPPWASMQRPWISGMASSPFARTLADTRKMLTCLASRRILAAQNASTKPLFLYFAQQLLHIPLQLPSDPKHAEACRHVRGGSAEVNRTVLCAMASRLDEFMGEMVSLLKGAGMYENSLIWAFSDNGGMTQWSDMFPASASSNFPLRGGKTTLFEGGVRTPSFIFGGALPATARGSKRRELLHAVDILPTFAGLAGFDTTSLPINGQDMWGTITGSQVTARSELPLNIAMNRDLSATAIPAFGRGWSEANYTAVIQWPYKLILGEPFIANLMGLPSDKDRGGWWGVEEYSYTPPPDSEKKLGAWLYNIDQDEGEHNNLAEQLPEVVANITQRVTGWWFSNSKSGYRRPQLNIPRLLSNPMLQNWTWGPFAHLGHSADGSTDASTDSSVSLLV